MYRRLLASTAAGAALLAGTAVPFLGSAGAAACPTFTDAPGDASTNGAAQPGTFNDNYDILGVTVGSAGDALRATIDVKKLNPLFGDTGDAFLVTFAVGDTPMMLQAQRTAAGTKATISNSLNATSAAATASFDVATNSVRITATQAAFDTAFGGSAAGKTAGTFIAQSWNHTGADKGVFYDRVEAPATVTHAVGVACGTVGVPGEVPEGFPKAGCNTVEDGGGDARVGHASAPDEPDLDITGVALKADADEVVAFVRVAALAARPKAAPGHQFAVNMKVAGKSLSFQTHAYEHAQFTDLEKQMVDNKVGGQQPPARLLVSTSYTPSSISAQYDLTNSVVIFRIPTEELVEKLPEFVPASEVTELTAVSSLKMPAGPATKADSTATDNAAAGTATWKIGDNACFGPPPATLENVGKVTAQYSDAAAVAAELTDAAGEGIAGKTVTFAIGSKRATARTNADGVARATLNPGVAAGSYELVTTFAGDDEAGEATVTTPFTVVAEKTKLALTVTKSGTSRTVVAKLLDDDNRAVAGQTIAWYVNGKKVSSAKTSSAGSATFKAAKAGQTVKATFTAVTGKYAGATASKKV